MVFSSSLSLNNADTVDFYEHMMATNGALRRVVGCMKVPCLERVVNQGFKCRTFLSVYHHKRDLTGDGGWMLTALDILQTMLLAGSVPLAILGYVMS